VVHVAAYSPRRATPSERLWADDVPPAEKKRRLHAVERLQAESAGEINRALDGAVLEVLVEGPSEAKGGRANSTLGEAPQDSPGAPGTLGDVSVAGAVETARSRWGGRTRGNKLVFFDAPYDPTGMLVDVLVTRTSPWYLEGQLLTPAPARARRLPVLA
jgi:tRNA-2-methylthio-N6-dimethylallyladenosine synthase